MKNIYIINFAFFVSYIKIVLRRKLWQNYILNMEQWEVVKLLKP